MMRLPSSASISPVMLPLLLLAVLVVLSYFHDTFEEWDGVMQYFAGRDILIQHQYAGWTSRFWPPLYSLLVGLGSSLVSGFVAAKVISVIASCLLVYVAYHLALQITSNRLIALLTQAFLCVNPTYLTLSIQAENHMLDALLFASGLTLFLQGYHKPHWSTVACSGIICGLAGLTRYTSYSLLILPLTFLVAKTHKAPLRKTVAFIGGFCLVSSPWWVYNTVFHTGPLSSWQYLNVGSALFSEKALWWWNAQSDFSNTLEILQAYPVDYLKNVMKNLWSGVVDTGSAIGVLALFWIPGMFDGVLNRPVHVWISSLIAFLFYLLLVSQAFSFVYVFLSWSVIFTPLCLCFLHRFSGSLASRHKIVRNPAFFNLVCALLIVISATFSARHIIMYLMNQKTDFGQLTDVKRVSQYLSDYDPEMSSKIVMSIHPARAYYLNSKWLMLPLYYRGDLEGLVQYRGISDKVKRYSPKRPAVWMDRKLRADYLVFDTAAARALPQFAYLLEGSGSLISGSFECIYTDSGVAVYDITY